MNETGSPASPPAAAPVTVSVEGVCRRFGEVTAVDGVTFDVRAGELFFLLGPSGCGKTTLLRILAGLETPDGGVVRLGGRDVAGLPPHERGAPMVFQNYALWPHLSVAANVGFGLVERRVPRAETARLVEEALARVGLAGLGGRLPGQLSGGQQQRVVLARALVLSPGVVLLDEPLSNLDARLRAEMRDELQALHAETDITFIYVTHDQVEALSLADRMAVMHGGRLMALGRPADLYHRPPNVFTADFLGESNLLPGRVTRADGRRLVVETAAGSWRGEAAGKPPREGAAVTCLVRPEHVRPAGPLPAANRFSAHIEAARMTGAVTALRLRTGAAVLRATVLSDYPAAYAAGAEGAWQVRPENVIVLPAQEAP